MGILYIYLDENDFFDARSHGDTIYDKKNLNKTDKYFETQLLDDIEEEIKPVVNSSNHYKNRFNMMETQMLDDIPSDTESDTSVKPKSLEKVGIHILERKLQYVHTNST